MTFKDENSQNGLCFVIDNTHKCNKQISQETGSGSTIMVDSTEFNQINLDDKHDICCSNNLVANVEPAGNSTITSDQSATTAVSQHFKHFITQNETSNNKTLPIKLVDGKDNFPSDDNQTFNLNLVELNNNSDLENKNVCLIDINKKNKKCPSGWTHSATTIRGYNICCKNT